MPSNVTIFSKCEPDVHLELLNRTGQFIEPFIHVSKETIQNVENTIVSVTCTEQFEGNHETYMSKFYFFRKNLAFHYLALTILGQIMTICSCFSHSPKRKFGQNKSLCSPIPGLPRFGDLVLGTRNRINWICLHVIMCETMFLILFDIQNLILPYLGFDWYVFYANDDGKSHVIIFRIVAVVFYFFFYSPLFVAVGDSSLFNQIIALIWDTYYIVLMIIYFVLLSPWFGTHDDHKPELIFMVRMPTLIACVLLWTSLIFKIYKLIRKGWLKIAPGAKDLTVYEKLFKIKHAKEPIEKLFGSSIHYLRNMELSSSYREVDGILNPIRHDQNFNNFWWMILKKLNYKPKYGYKYPTRVLCGVSCNLILLWSLICKLCWNHIGDIYLLITTATETGTDLENWAKEVDAFNFLPPYFSKPGRITEYIKESCYAVATCFFVSFALAFINCLFGIFQHFTNFRLHSRKVRRGFRHNIATDQVNAFTSISAAMKYGAYTCAYPIWGMAFQFGLWMIILTTITLGVFLPIKIDWEKSWLVQFFRKSWPGWLYTAVIMLAQKVLTRFVFSIDRNATKILTKYDRGNHQGHILLNNRLLFDILSLFFWFNYIFIGFFSLLSRVWMTVLMALIYIGRIDQPAVQRNRETMDSGYAVYLGYHGFLEGNTHPIMLVALQFFLAGPAGTRYRNRINGKNSDITLYDKAMQNAKYRAKWRWQFCYFLVKNPTLVIYRKNLRKKRESQRDDSIKVVTDPTLIPGLEIEEVQI